jgi:hypothetical protein
MKGLFVPRGVYDIRVVTHSRPDPTIDPTRVNYFHGALNCSLDMLYDIHSGDLLAIIHDGYLQKMRVQATMPSRRVIWQEKIPAAWR